MEAQFNFQLRHRNDKREWEDIEVYYQTYCNRTTAIHYARELCKRTFQDIQFGSPIDRGKRATENKRNIYLRTNRTFKNYKLWQTGVAIRLLLRATKPL